MDYKYQDVDKQMQKQIMTSMAGKEVLVRCHWCGGSGYLTRGDTSNNPDRPITYTEKCQVCDGEGAYRVIF